MATLRSSYVPIMFQIYCSIIAKLECSEITLPQIAAEDWKQHRNNKLYNRQLLRTQHDHDIIILQKHHFKRSRDTLDLNLAVNDLKAIHY